MLKGNFQNKVIEKSEKRIMMATSNELDVLPPELFDNIMFLVGCESPEMLDICRQVCRAWNEKIMNSLKVNPSKKWGPSSEEDSS